MGTSSSRSEQVHVAFNPSVLLEKRRLVLGERHPLTRIVYGGCLVISLLLQSFYPIPIRLQQNTFYAMLRQLCSGSADNHSGTGYCPILDSECSDSWDFRSVAFIDDVCSEYLCIVSTTLLVYSVNLRTIILFRYGGSSSTQNAPESVRLLPFLWSDLQWVPFTLGLQLPFSSVWELSSSRYHKSFHREHDQKSSRFNFLAVDLMEQPQSISSILNRPVCVLSFQEPSGGYHHVSQSLSIPIWPYLLDCIQGNDLIWDSDFGRDVNQLSSPVVASDGKNLIPKVNSGHRDFSGIRHRARSDLSGLSLNGPTRFLSMQETHVTLQSLIHGVASSCIEAQGFTFEDETTSPCATLSPFRIEVDNQIPVSLSDSVLNQIFDERFSRPLSLTSWLIFTVVTRTVARIMGQDIAHMGNVLLVHSVTRPVPHFSMTYFYAVLVASELLLNMVP
ncbi:hypothetical protein Tco_0526504 [Tanacetum coccineum]